MKQMKKVVTVFMLVLAMVTPFILPTIGNVTYASAATIKISRKTLTLEEGKSKVLKISGTKKVVTWTSGKKSVATVTDNGKVTAKAAGTAVITAVTGGKKYTCKVTVTKKKVQNYKDSTYETTEEMVEDFNVSIPKDWIFFVDAIAAPSPDQVDKIHRYKLMPQDADYGNNIVITTELTDKESSKYEEVKSVLADQFTTSTKELESMDIKVTDFVTSDVTNDLGSALCADYKITVDGTIYQITAYKFCYKNYFITVEVSETKDMGLNTVATNLINSIH